MDSPSQQNALKEQVQRIEMRLDHEATQDGIKAIKKELLESNLKIFDRAQSYVNVISIAGYAAAFTIWSTNKTAFTLKINLTIALLLGFSLAIFVAWEMYSMLYRSRGLVNVHNLIRDNPNPDDFINAFNVEQEKARGQNLGPVGTWRVVFTSCIGLAVAAIALMFYNTIAALASWPLWPT